MLRKLRDRVKLLVAIGTCAVWGGVQAMKNEISREELKQQVYGPAATLPSPTLTGPGRFVTHLFLW